MNIICTRLISKGETIDNFFIKLEESNKTRVFFQMNVFLRKRLSPKTDSGSYIFRLWSNPKMTNKIFKNMYSFLAFNKSAKGEISNLFLAGKHSFENT